MTEPTLKEIRQRHDRQPPSTITMSDWKDIDFLLRDVEHHRKFVLKLREFLKAEPNSSGQMIRGPIECVVDEVVSESERIGLPE